MRLQTDRGGILISLKDGVRNEQEAPFVIGYSRGTGVIEICCADELDVQGVEPEARPFL